MQPKQKAWSALKFALFLGVSLGFAHVLWFFLHEGYRLQEIQPTALNLFQISINRFTVLALLGGVMLGLAWIGYARFEGLLLAGLVIGFLFAPLLYLVNKRYLPGIYEPISLVGNGFLLLTAAGLTFVTFKRWTYNWRFIKHFSNKYLFLSTLFVLIVVNVFAGLQPAYRKLVSVTPSTDELIKLMNRVTLEKALAGHKGFDGSVKTNKELLEAYYEFKSTKRIKQLQEEIADRDRDAILANADSILKGSFTFVGKTEILPEKINWRANPTNDQVWLFALNRQEWLWNLAAAYLLTDSTKYAAEFEKIMRSWFEQNSLEKWKNEDDPVWRLLNTSLRITGSWRDAFFVFFPSAEVSEDIKWQMLASIHEQAQFLMHFRSPERNHLIQESFGLIAAAGVFPEFKISEQWLAMANFRIDHALENEIYPDGGYNEVSTFYHRYVIRILQQIADFAKKNEIKLSDIFYEQLEHMYTFLMYTAWPNGVMPQINDGFHAKNLRILFETPADMFARDDFAFFATGGERGVKPEKRSIAFPYSGIYVMRSDWSDQARYMIVDAGLYGSAHGHEDKLSFELFAFGRPFIVESGTYTYVFNKWQKYFKSSFAHNTIVVDGRSQKRAPFSDKWVSSPPEKLPNTWISNDAFDYLEAKYDEGYGNIKEDILKGPVHTRRILFVKPDYWIFWDVVEGQDQHAVEELFHFPAEPNVAIENGRDVHVTYPAGMALWVQSLKPDSVSISQIEGEESPVQGWVSSVYGEKSPAPVIDYEIKSQLPVTFLNVLYPVQNPETKKGIKAAVVPISVKGRDVNPDKAVALKITSEFSTDLVLIAPGVKEEKQFADSKTMSEFLLIRKFTDGRRTVKELGEIAN